MNLLKVNDICNHCNLINAHKQATYGEAELDYILISENIAQFYSVRKSEPKCFKML